MRIRVGLGALLAGLLVAVGAAVAVPALQAGPDPTGLTTGVDGDPAAAALVARADEALGEVDVRGRAPLTGYDRDLYGEGWAVESGCDLRNRTLSRDLTEVVHRPGTQDCLVESGVLADPYTGETIGFRRGPDTSPLVQIDHVVPLALSWQQGAQAWTPQQRERFANDPANLQATDGETNQDKGASGPGSWLPPSTAYRCVYVSRFVLVSQAYGLSMNPGDHDMSTRVLADC